MKRYFDHWIDVISVSALSPIKVEQIDKAFAFSFVIYLPQQILRIECKHLISGMRGLRPGDYFFEEKFNLGKVTPKDTVEYDNFQKEYHRLLRTIHFEKLPKDSLEKSLLFEKQMNESCLNSWY